MAMNGREMANSVVNTLLAGQSVDEDTKKTMMKSWVKICDNIVKHIQQNATVKGEFPASPNSSRTSYTRDEMGEPAETEEPYFDVELKIQ